MIVISSTFLWLFLLIFKKYSADILTFSSVCEIGEERETFLMSHTSCHSCVFDWVIYCVTIFGKVQERLFFAVYFRSLANVHLT
jgi:hypothetical protein